MNARNPRLHTDLNFPTHFVGTCVDHTIELKIEAALNMPSNLLIKSSVTNCRKIVNYMKVFITYNWNSNNFSPVAFLRIQPLLD